MNVGEPASASSAAATLPKVLSRTSVRCSHGLHLDATAQRGEYRQSHLISSARSERPINDQSLQPLSESRMIRLKEYVVNIESLMSI